MATSKPTILLKSLDARTYRIEEILSARAIWAVLLDGNPINIRSVNTTTQSAAKYRQTSFPNPAHAKRLADRLNRVHRTDRFTVGEIAWTASIL